ncbi:peptide chain release factor N(5)-glutamine methyltransferase [Alkaliphilus metalliredigens]|uniref:peptide chain release factor N(5)-glutamine methyltransferase n=1 Tax=Alkaliphilus metalliredigens TaxID=208226 RepID=UPI0005A16219|nr:peptide chain release factor N(5)-glutamine methyltransferase [Alkaliphilus metalliredigens]
MVDLLKEATAVLKEIDVDTPQLDAEVILCHLLKTERIQLHIYPERKVDEEVQEQFWEGIQKRKKRMPVQYIVGTQEFMGLDFRVESGVLIPRADTEILVESVLGLYEVHYNNEAVALMDIGTGSGAIAISLARFIERSKIYAIDLSEKALEIAENNGRTNEVQHKISFFYGSLFEPLKGYDLEGTFQFVISNPPYIPPDVVEELSPQVKDYEPRMALEGGADGLDFYREIVEKAPQYLQMKGWLCFEIGYDQGEQVKGLMETRGFSRVEVIRDLAGLDRVVIGQWTVENR